MLPETRNSHLAAKRERRKARKMLRRIEEKKKALQMSSPVKIVPNPTTIRRKSGQGDPLAQADRDEIIAAIGRIGVDRVVKDLMREDKNRNRNSVVAMVRGLRLSASHRYSSTTRSLLATLAQFYRGGDQAKLPLPVRPQYAPQPGYVAAAAPLATAPQVAPSAPESLNVQTISAVVIAVLQGLGLGTPKAQEPPLLAAATMPEPGIRQFEDMDARQQRSILNSLHNRYGDSLFAQGMLSGQHAAAWNISYDAYDAAMGTNVKARTTAESDASGTRLRPIDLIEREGGLVRFFQICRKTWER